MELGGRNWLVVSVLLFMLLPGAWSFEEALCAGLGFEGIAPFDPAQPSYTEMGFKSMGSSAIFRKSLSLIWGINPAPRGDPKYQFMDLEIYSLKGMSADGTMRPLNGWLLLRAKVIDRMPKSRFVALAIWALTDRMEPYGQFVYLKSDPCGWNAKVSADNLIPCSATPINAAINPSMFVFKDDSSTGQVKEINVLWKVDSSYCDLPTFFKFMVGTHALNWYDYPSGLPTAAYVNLKYDPGQEDWGSLMFTTEPLIPTQIYGPASPLQDAVKQIDCSSLESVTDTKAVWLDAKLTQINKWTKFGTLRFADKEYYADRFVLVPTPSGPATKPNWTAINTTAVCTGGYAKVVRHLFQTFGGRCKEAREDVASAGNTHRVTGSPDTVPTCKPRSPPPPTTGDYHDAIEDRRRNLTKVGCTCPRVPTEAEVLAVTGRSGRSKRTVEEPQVQNQTNATAKSRELPLAFIDAIPYYVEGEGCRFDRTVEEYDLLGLCKDSAAGRNVAGIRKWHASALLFNTMILIPASVYIARYLKGVLPNDPRTQEPRILLRAWYLTHCILGLPMVCMIVTSASSISRQLPILGRSHHWSATFHYYSGNTIYALIGILIVSGFLRPIDLIYRRLMIWFHLFVGYFVHFFGVVVCLFTYRIPASPLSFLTLLDPNSEFLSYHIGALVFIGWFIINTIIFLYAQCYKVYFMWRYLEVRFVDMFIGFPMMLPLRVNNFIVRRDQLFRELERNLWILGGVQAFFGFAGWLAVITLMHFFNDIKGQGYGIMQCTHDSNGRFTIGLDNTTDIFTKRVFCPDASEFDFQNMDELRELMEEYIRKNGPIKPEEPHWLFG